MMKVGLIQVRVACAESGPYADEACRFLAASERLGTERPEAYGFKCQLALSFFHTREWLEDSQEDPIPQFRDALQRYTAAMRAVAEIMTNTHLSVESSDRDDTAFSLTGDHYGALFADFDPAHYFEEPVQLLRQRLERNGFPAGRLGEVALDAGCGNGRYAVALRKLGFPFVIGVDFSPVNIEVASRWCLEAGLDGVEYRLGNVLELPVPDASCSFVFSNGVLHHTGNILQGLREIHRVLKPGGTAYFKIMPNPGGIYWDAIELSRHLMRDVPYDLARRFLALAGVPPHRRYYVLDHMMVPINERLTAVECEQAIAQAGFLTAIRCTRGADIDRLEQLYQGTPFARAKYGDGVNLYRLMK